MQDEWGLYDPEQCGFAALLERLDELTRTNAEEKKDGEGRLLSCAGDAFQGTSPDAGRAAVARIDGNGPGSNT
jgi:hypothetical protein